MIQRLNRLGWMLLITLLGSVGAKAQTVTFDTSSSGKAYMSTSANMSATTTSVTLSSGTVFYVIRKDWNASTTVQDIARVTATIYPAGGNAQARRRTTGNGPGFSNTVVNGVEQDADEANGYNSYNIYKVDLSSVSSELSTLTEGYTIEVNVTLQNKTDLSTLTDADFTFTNLPLTYNGSNQGPVFTISGLTYDRHYTYSQSTTIVAGNYTATIYGKAGSHYTGSKTIPYTIGRKPITITANPQTVTYGTAITTGVGQVTYPDLVGNDALTSITLTQSTTNVTTTAGSITPSAATIKDGETDMTSNYTISYANGALTIEQLEASLSWGNLSLPYTGSAQKPTCTVTNLVGSDVCTVTVDGGQTNVGSHTATATALSNANYKLPSTVTQAFSITAVAASVTAPTAITDVLTYNGNNQALVTAGSTPDGTLKYFVNTTGTAPTTSTEGWTESVSVGKDVGTYYVWYYVEADGNHTSSAVTAITGNTKAIGKATLTATADDKSRTYGSENPELTVTVTGFVNGETASTAAGYTAPTASTTATSTTNDGTYDITPSGGSADNYEFTYVDGTLTVSAKTLTTDMVAPTTLPEGTWTGTVQSFPTITVTDGTLLSSTDYNIKWYASGSTVEITPQQFTNRGTYQAVITGQNNYTGSVTRDFTVGATTISTQTITLSPTTAVFAWDGTNNTAKDQKPTVTITGLTEDTDFEVAWKKQAGTEWNATTAVDVVGTYKAVVTGKGNYKDTKESGEFTITAKPLSDADIEVMAIANATYTGAAQNPASDITLKIKEGSSYIYTLTSADIASIGWDDDGLTNAKTYTATITGQGNFTGTTTATYTIGPKALADNMITLDATSGTWTGSAQSFPGFSVDDDGHLAASDYTSKWVKQGETTELNNYTDRGTYELQLTGQGNYTGSATKTFTVGSQNIEGATFVFTPASATYKENASHVATNQTPAFAVSKGGNNLTAGTHYNATIQWQKQNGTSWEDVSAVDVAGTYRVKIEGMGDYSGTTYSTETFTVSPFTLTNDHVSVGVGTSMTASVQYDGAGYQPSVSVVVNHDGTDVTLRETDDYTITYPGGSVSTLTALGGYIFTVTGQGNYAGSGNQTFTITSRKIDDATIALTDASNATYTGSKQDPAENIVLTMTNSDNSTYQLINGTDYEITWDKSELTNADTYTGTIKGKGNFAQQGSETRTTTYTIDQKALAAEMITLDANSSSWTGSAQPFPGFTVDDDGHLAATDYTYKWVKQGETTELTTFTDRGVYELQLTGQGNYTGSAVKTFTVGTQNIEGATITFTPSSATFKEDASHTAIDQTPALTVTKDGNDLTEGTHYNLKWQKYNSDSWVDLSATETVALPGAYRVVITGIGDYASQATSQSFEVAQYTLTDANVTMAEAGVSTLTYDGTEHQPVLVVKVTHDATEVTLRKDIDYVITAPDDFDPADTYKAAGAYSFTITGAGNYAGGGSATFTINPLNYDLAFSGTGKWATFYNDEQVRLKRGDTASGLTAYIVTDVSATSVTAEEISGDVIPAKMPVLLNRGTSTATSFACEIIGDDMMNMTPSISNFVGVGTDTSILRGNYILVGDVFVRSDAGTLPANRCYLTILGSSSARSIVVDNGAGTTAIETMESESESESADQWYSLDGHRIDKPVQKGIYIKNNKKVVIK